MGGRWLIAARSAGVISVALIVAVVLVWVQTSAQRPVSASSSFQRGPAGSLAGAKARPPVAVVRLLIDGSGIKPRLVALGGGPPVIGSTQQALINRDRARAGLAPLTWSACLRTVAVANARRMAAQGYISHTNGPWLDLDCHLGAQGGENVGWWSEGIDDAQLNAMFMASADHRANIMGPYHYVATAWAVAANGYAYIAVEFA